MLQFKNNIKSWKFWYKLIWAIIIIFFVFEMMARGLIHIKDPNKLKNGQEEPSVWTIYDKNGAVIGYDYFGFVLFYFCFFTIQTNLLVAFWMLYGVINHNKEGQDKILNRVFSLSVTVYITITSLIFNFMLLPQMLTSSEFKGFGPLGWVEQIIMHTIAPLACIIYFLFFFKCQISFSFKQFIRTDFVYLLIYPLIYLIVTLIRGELIYRSMGCDSKLTTKAKGYPYFFLEIHNKNVLNLNNNNILNYGIFWFFVALIAICSIMIGLGSLYIFIASKTSNIRTNIDNKRKKSKPNNSEIEQITND